MTLRTICYPKFAKDYVAGDGVWFIPGLPLAPSRSHSAPRRFTVRPHPQLEIRLRALVFSLNTLLDRFNNHLWNIVGYTEGMDTLLAHRRDKYPQPQVVEDLSTGLVQHHTTKILVSFFLAKQQTSHIRMLNHSTTPVSSKAKQSEAMPENNPVAHIPDSIFFCPSQRWFCYGVPRQILTRQGLYHLFSLNLPWHPPQWRGLWTSYTHTGMALRSCSS